MIREFRTRFPNDLAFLQAECDLAARRGDLARATAITQDMLARHDVTLDEVEGLIDILRRTSEAEVTCVLKEEEDGTIRVSLRSLGAIDVRRVAEAHGGGGHRFAAGFTSDLDIPTLIARITAAL